jgi:hypothetical protein
MLLDLNRMNRTSLEELVVILAQPYAFGLSMHRYGDAFA